MRTKREASEGHEDTTAQMSPTEPVVWSAALIVNTRSRVGEGAFAEARDLLRTLGVPLGAAYAVHDPVRLQETVREALLEGHELIVLGGGDGSVSTVVDLFVGTEAVLGLLPLGTANDFARTVGVPLELGRACSTVAGGRVVDVDLGRAGDNYYVNVASVGLGSEVTEALSPRLDLRLPHESNEEVRRGPGPGRDGNPGAGCCQASPGTSQFFESMREQPHLEDLGICPHDEYLAVRDLWRAGRLGRRSRDENGRARRAIAHRRRTWIRTSSR